MRYLSLLLILCLYACSFARADTTMSSLCRGDGFIPRSAEAMVERSENGREKLYEKSMVYYAALLGRHDKLRKWITSGISATEVDKNILADSVAADQLVSVKILISSGISPDLPTDHGTTPLMVAVQCDRLEISTFLIASGANVNARTPDGMDAMIAAIMEGNHRMVRLLLDNGFNLQRSKTKKGLTAIEIAKRRGEKKILEILSSGEKPAL